MLDIKPSHKPIKEYYAALEEFKKHGVIKETSVRNAFQELLVTYSRKLKWSFIEEYGITLSNKNKGSVDGALLDGYSIVMGYWEAKDSGDDLKKEIQSKFDKGYPRNNILFQEPLKAVLYQDTTFVDTYDLTNPESLCNCLEDFFGYKANEQVNWEEIVNQFKDRIPDSATKLVQMIEEEKKSNLKFRDAFKNFAELCRASINPNLADPAIEEMLVQHLLTSRIFGSVFANPDFIRRNVIASEIENVIDALTSRSFNKKEFFAPLDHFYVALERRAESISEWSQKQSFLNTVYEKFFQGFAVKVADTHGIVYTPQPIVDFMVRSVEHILQTEFDRSLGDEGVHILDPFVGTGNFLMRIMREIPKTKLPKKYHGELHCNEVMLLPYYIASMNIEHEFYTQTGKYEPFDGICLVDTFELAEPAQATLFSTENSERVNKQKRSPIFVIIGNPPYNAGQVNENDNNKNRKYPVIDKRVNETYAKDSKATLVNQLSDPYVKAFRYASDRIGEEGVIAYVTNNSFLEGIAFDGMRKHLSQDFSSLYILDLGGNVRKNPKLSGTTHNVFGIQVGVSINLLVKKQASEESGKIYYSRVDEFWKRGDKYRYLNSKNNKLAVEWQELNPDNNNNWLNEGITVDFDAFIPMGSKEAKRNTEVKAIFVNFSNGVKTNNDSYTYNYDDAKLFSQAGRMVDNYNSELDRWHRRGQPKDLDSFLSVDEKTLKWIRNTKRTLLRGKKVEIDIDNIRVSSYRPFTKQYLFFDRAFSEDTYQNPFFYPFAQTENVSICVSGSGASKEFQVVVINDIACHDFLEKTQCFPFYVYDEDGSNRRENITDWALAMFNEQLRMNNEGKGKKKKDSTLIPNPSPLKGEGDSITKWDIFYYVYGLLHHPQYRTKYAANLRRELPRIPISKDFWKFSELGKKLADLHVNYESAKEYRLEEVWKDGAGLDLSVVKMKLSKDKTDIIYNDKLTLRGIPAEAFEYKLGNRSAVDWIIDQYQVSTDKRSGITNDPNKLEEPDYIIKLLRKVVTLSVETVKLVKETGQLTIEN